MASHPEEPIVALDNINKHDPEALECPVERAFDVVATCFQEDPLTRFFAKPGKEKEYCSCLLRALRQEHFIIYECCTFSAVALVTDTGDLPMGYLEDKETQK